MLGRYIEPMLTDFFMSRGKNIHMPVSGTFELSPICNFNCRMCYVHRKKCELEAMGKTILPPEFWIDLAKKAVDNGMLYLLLTGGEPFLYPGFKEVYEAVKEMGVIISINTNGSLIDEEWVEYLKDNPPTKMNITLYGGSDESYEKMCGVKNGYTKVTKAILMLKDAGVNVKLNCSLTPDNEDELESIINFADENDIILEVATYMFPQIRLDVNNKGHNRRFTAEEMAEKDLKISRLMRGEETYREHVNFLKNRKCIIPGVDSECSNNEGTQLLCRAGTAAFWVTWEGNITPCGMMPVPKVSLADKDFNTAWKELVDKTLAIRLAPECAGCENKDICHSCAGMTYAENADFTKRPDYLCRYVKELKLICQE